MPVITVYRHGGKGGVAPGKNSHMRVKRGDVEGWSEGATRRNTQFLQSIEETKLRGQAGVAITLTLKDCPETPADWHKIRRAWIERMRRAGMVRLHWVTEWQRRGVPHLHGAIWFEDAYKGQQAMEAWCAVASPYGASLKGQHWRIIDGPIGWFQYLAKHAARGVKHYQRNVENIPESWQSKTGRVWGHVGDWPLAPARKFGLQGENGDGGFFHLRRMVRSWRVADARASGISSRLKYARRMLQSNDAKLSRLRGFSEWMPGESVQLRMLANLAVRGFLLVDRDTGEVLCGDYVDRSGLDEPAATPFAGSPRRSAGGHQEPPVRLQSPP